MLRYEVLETIMDTTLEHQACSKDPGFKLLNTEVVLVKSIFRLTLQKETSLNN